MILTDHANKVLVMSPSRQVLQVGRRLRYKQVAGDCLWQQFDPHCLMIAEDWQLAIQSVRLYNGERSANTDTLFVAF